MQPISRRHIHVAICNIPLFLSPGCSKKSNTKLHPAVNNLPLSAASGHLYVLTFKQPTYAFTLVVLTIFSLVVLHRKWGQTASFCDLLWCIWFISWVIVSNFAGTTAESRGYRRESVQASKLHRSFCSVCLLCYAVFVCFILYLCP